MKVIKLSALTAIALAAAVTSLAQTWTQAGLVAGTWQGLAASADGSVLLAAGGNTGAYISTNSGTSWFPLGISPAYQVSVSADGGKFIIFGSSVLATTNAGSSWTTNTLSATPWSVATSADGTKIMTSANGTGTFISTNSGTSWKSVASVSSSKLAVSADGTEWYYLAYNSTNIYVSTNLGVTWSHTNGPAFKAISLAVSADGQILLAGGVIGPLCVSTNSGASWRSTDTPVTNWFYVAASADGRHLLGTSRGSPANGPVYTSGDGGINWISNNITAQLWSGAAASADGGTLLVCYPNLVYGSQSIIPPQLNSTGTTTNMTVSWGIPSTNFVLQQSSDLAGWSVVTNVPVLNLTNLQNQVMLPASGHGFFRLRTP